MPVRRSKPSADRILESCEKAFAQHGYSEVSLRQLMAAAGVSTTAFYARFDSKEAVIAALVTRLFGDLYAAAPTVLDRARDLETGIDVGVDLLCDQFGPRRALVRLILSEAGSAKAAVDARRTAYATLAGFLANRIHALASRADRRTGREPAQRPSALELARRDPDAVAWALVGALEIQIVRWAVWNQIELPELRIQLRAAARAILPRLEADATSRPNKETP